MFSKTIVLSDAFLDMPMSARCLYFTLGMLAGNKGELVGVKSIIRGMNCELDDLQVLIENGYIRKVDDEKYAITHWYVNNSSVGDRSTPEYYKWKKDVLKRDNYTCQKCGDIECLEVHHIIPFFMDENLRVDVDNGITLCRTCHRNFHKEVSYEQQVLLAKTEKRFF